MKISRETAETIAKDFNVGINSARLSGMDWRLRGLQVEGGGWVRLTIEGGERIQSPQLALVTDLMHDAERQAPLLFSPNRLYSPS